MTLAAGCVAFHVVSRSQSSETLDLPHYLGGPHAIACQSNSSCLVIGEDYLAKGGFVGKANFEANSITFTDLNRSLPVATALSCYAKDRCLVSFVSNSTAHALAQFSPSTVSTNGVSYLAVPSQFQQVNAIYCESDSSICLVVGKARGNYNFALSFFSTITASFIGKTIVKTLPDVGGVYDISCNRRKECLATLENFDGTAGILDSFSLNSITPGNLSTLRFQSVATPTANLLLAVSCSVTNCLVGGTDSSSIHGLLFTVDMTNPSHPYQQIALPKNQGPVLAVGDGEKIIFGGYQVYSNYGDIATVG